MFILREDDSSPAFLKTGHRPCTFCKIWKDFSFKQQWNNFVKIGYKFRVNNLNDSHLDFVSTSVFLLKTSYDKSVLSNVESKIESILNNRHWHTLPLFRIKLDIFQNTRVSSLFTSNFDLDRLCIATLSIFWSECDKCPTTFYSGLWLQHIQDWTNVAVRFLLELFLWYKLSILESIHSETTQHF